MSVFTPTKEDKEEAKVHHSQYIRTENTPDEGAKPAEPGKPTQPEAK
ncbi:MAG TPA: hypothetical protein VL737_05380 [Candidatus Pristimantibacillus sp.]|jgi:hypothetical protein|nr:hypothetical protein [Candidatus Pristimantibacillus sp.]